MSDDLKRGVDAQLALARAAMDPNAAIAAADVADASPVELEAPAGVPAPQRVHAITMSVEVDQPPPHRRWRFFCMYWLMKLAAWFYPCRVEFYRTRRPWE